MPAPIIYYCNKNEKITEVINKANSVELEEYFNNFCDHRQLLKNSNVPFNDCRAVKHYPNDGRALRSALLRFFDRTYIDKYPNYTELIITQQMIHNLTAEYIKIKKSFQDVSRMLRKHHIYADKPSLYFNNLREKLTAWYREEEKLSIAKIDKLLRDYNQYLMYEESFGSPVFIKFDGRNFLNSFGEATSSCKADCQEEVKLIDIYKLKIKIIERYKVNGDENIIFLTAVAGEYYF